MEEGKKSIATPDTPVLIADDSVQYSMVLSKILDVGFGYKNITKVDSLEAAYAKIKENPDYFRLIFVDYRFPSGKTGGDFLEQLKAENLLVDKVAFLITSEPSPENLKQAVVAGAMGLIAKPFDREQLKKQLERAERSIWAGNLDYF
jgi:DNA-binding NtrC family response regulator